MLKWTVRFCLFLIVATGATLQYNIHFNPHDGKQKITELQNNISQLKIDILSKRNKNKALITRLHDIKKNPEAIEEEARQSLFMIKKGETYILPVIAK